MIGAAAVLIALALQHGKSSVIPSRNICYPKHCRDDNNAFDCFDCGRDGNNYGNYL